MRRAQIVKCVSATLIRVLSASRRISNAIFCRGDWLRDRHPEPPLPCHSQVSRVAAPLKNLEWSRTATHFEHSSCAACWKRRPTFRDFLDCALCARLRITWAEEALVGSQGQREVHPLLRDAQQLDLGATIPE